jgi:hypothetical protein
MRLAVRHQIFPNEGRWFSPAANLRILATISTFLSTHLPDSRFGNLSCAIAGKVLCMGSPIKLIVPSQTARRTVPRSALFRNTRPRKWALEQALRSNLLPRCNRSKHYRFWATRSYLSGPASNWAHASKPQCLLGFALLLLLLLTLVPSSLVNGSLLTIELWLSAT